MKFLAKTFIICLLLLFSCTTFFFYSSQEPRKYGYRLTQITTGSDIFSAYSYNTDGSLKEIIKQDEVSRFYYDGKTYVTKIESPAATYHFSYNDEKEVTTSREQEIGRSDETGKTQTYEYDQNGRLIKEKIYSEISNLIRSVSYEYDGDDKILSITSAEYEGSKADIFIRSFFYDNEGLLIGSKYSKNNTPLSKTVYEHKQIDGASVVISRIYKEDTPIRSHRYTYNAEGLLEKIEYNYDDEAAKREYCYKWEKGAIHKVPISVNRSFKTMRISESTPFNQLICGIY